MCFHCWAAYFSPLVCAEFVDGPIRYWSQLLVRRPEIQWRPRESYHYVVRRRRKVLVDFQYSKALMLRVLAVSSITDLLLRLCLVGWSMLFEARW